MGRVDFFWGETGSFFDRSYLIGVRGRFRSYPLRSWLRKSGGWLDRWVRWLAAQVHHRAANRSRKKVLQPASAAHLPYVCKLVGRVPWPGGRSAIPEENERTDVRGAGRNMVLATSVKVEERKHGSSR